MWGFFCAKNKVYWGLWSYCNCVFQDISVGERGTVKMNGHHGHQISLPWTSFRGVISKDITYRSKIFVTLVTWSKRFVMPLPTLMRLRYSEHGKKLIAIMMCFVKLMVPIKRYIKWGFKKKTFDNHWLQ